MRIRRIDVFSLLQSIFTDTTHYGFTDVVHPCLDPITTSSAADPDHTFFWDLFHPTVFGHAFFAATALAALSQ